MADKTGEKWTLRLFILAVIGIGAIASWQLLFNKNYSMYITPMVVIVLGITGLLHLGWKNIRALWDSKFKYSDIMNGVTAIFYVLTIVAGVGLISGWNIPIISSVAGVVVAVTTLLSLPQLALPK